MEIKSRVDLYKELYQNLIYNHNNTILRFADIEEEYNSFYNSASVYDASHYSIFRVTGKDSIDFLQRISTNDLINLQDFNFTTTLLLNEKGRLIDRLEILKFPDHLILIGSPDNHEKVERWIEKYAILEDIKVERLIEQFYYLILTGKKLSSFFTLLFGDQQKFENLEPKKIYRYFNEKFSCWIFLNSFVGESHGVGILFEKSDASEVINYIHNYLYMFNVKFVGNDAFNQIRIEQGLPIYPNEINDELNPYEVNLIKYVSFTKGCYIGQEVVARLETYDKVKRTLKGFIITDAIEIADKSIYDSNGIVVGTITSHGYSNKLKQIVGLCIVSKKLSQNELDQVYIIDNAEKVKIKIKDLPLINL